MKRKINVIALLLFIVFTAIIYSLPAYALIPVYMSNSSDRSDYVPTNSDLADSDDDAKITDEIKAKVAELDYDPVKIYEFVKNNIDFIPYYGSKLGATGTLYEKRANSFDQASLLIAMYRSIGIPCRYVGGFIYMKKENVMNWFGMDSEKAVKDMVHNLGLYYYQNNDIIYYYDENKSYFLFYHVWVEVYLPYSGKRGKPLSDRKYDSAKNLYTEKGEGMWIPLDPSFKKYENKFPVKLPQKMNVSAIDFLNQYINSPIEKMPDELYVENLKKYLACKYPEYSIEDLTFERYIIPENTGVLPAELSPEISISLIFYENSKINGQWEMEITIDNEGETCNPVHLSYNYPMSKLYNKRITLSFDYCGSASGDDYYKKVTNQYNLNNYGSFFKPVLRIEGVPQNNISTTPTVGLYRRVNNTVYRSNVRIITKYTCNSNVIYSPPEVKSSSIQTGSYLSIFLNYNRTSKDIIESRLKKLKDIETKIDNGTTGSCIEPPISEILYSFGAQYFKNYSDSHETLSLIMNNIVFVAFSHGFVKQNIVLTNNGWDSGPINLDVFENTIFAISRSSDTMEELNYLLISGMTGSAHEHKVFEEMLNVKAVSTMRVLRMAEKAPDNEIFYITKNNYNEYMSKFASDGIDYSFISTHFGTSAPAENDDDIFIIPKRKTNTAEAGESTGTAYIKILDKNGSASYIITNDKGEKLNGGLLTVSNNSNYTSPTYYTGMQGYNCSSANASKFDVLYNSGSGISYNVFNNSVSPSYQINRNSLQTGIPTGSSIIIPNNGNSLILGNSDNIGYLTNSYFSDPGNQNYFGRTNLSAYIGNDNFTSSNSDAINKTGIFSSIINKCRDIFSLSADPVDMRTGEFYAEGIDINIPGKLPIIIKRNYSSNQETFDFVGYGWILNLNYFLWGNRCALALEDDCDGNNPDIKSVVFRLAENDGSVIEYNFFSENTNEVVFKPNPSTNPELINVSDDGIGASAGFLGNQIVYYKSTAGKYAHKFVYTSYTGLTKIFGYQKYLKNNIPVKERLYLEEIRDIYGNYLRYSYYDDPNYSGYGLPQQIVNKSGSFVDFEYDSSGRVVRLSSSDRREVKYVYDNVWNLIEVIDASGMVTKYEYDKSNNEYPTHNLLRIIKPDNRILENVYADNKVVEQKAAIGFNSVPERTNRFVYSTDSLGNRITTVYTSIYKNNSNQIIESKKEYIFDDVWAKAGQCILNFDNNTVSNSAIQNNITITNNGCTVTTDKSLEFNSSTDNLSISTTQIGTIKTIEFAFKFKLDIASNSSNIIFYQQDNQLNRIYFDNTAKRIKAVFNGESLQSDKTDWDNDGWYHISVNQDTKNGKLILNINGLMEDNIDSTSTNLISGTDNISITGGTQTYPVYLDNIEFYSILKAPGRKSPLRLISDKSTGFNNELNVEILREWDTNGNLRSVTDAKNNITTYSYDDNQRLISTTLNDNDITTYSYLNLTDPVLKNKITQITDPLNNKTEYVYDENDNESDGYSKGALKSIKKFLKSDYFDCSDTSCIEETYTYTTDGFIKDKKIAYGTVNETIYEYEYDRFGNIVAITNPVDEVHTFAYNEWGNLVRKTNALNESTIYEYDSANRLIKTVDPLGNRSYITYDKNSNKKIIKDMRGYETYFLYDYSNSPLGVVDPNGHIVITNYDIFGNTLFVTNQNGYTKQFRYDGLNRLCREIDFITDNFGVNEYDLIYTYDNNNNITKKEKIKVGGTTIYRIEYEYNYRNQIISEKKYKNNSSFALIKYYYDKIGNKTIEEYYINNGTTLDKYISYLYSTEWDGLYRIKQIEKFKNGNSNPLSSISFTYDKRGNKITETDPMSVTTLYEYDKANRLIKITKPLNNNENAITEYKYDKAGKLIEVIDPNGHSTFTEYDSCGRIIAVKDGQNRITRYEYDAAGNKTKEILPSGTTTTYTYDPLNRLTAITDGKNNSTTIEYDAVGNKISSTDANNNITIYEYDELNRLVGSIDPMGNEINYSYNFNSDGYLEKIMSASINTNSMFNTKWVYNWRSENTVITKGEGVDQVSSSFAYDDYGRLITKITPNNKTISYSYDADGNLSEISFDQTNRDTISYKYDKMGRRLLMCDKSGTTLYGYDYAGRLVLKSMSNYMSVSYKYDNADNLTRMIFSGLNQHGLNDPPNSGFVNQTVNYTYDNANNLLSVEHNGKTTQYKYNEDSLLAKKTYPNGLTTVYEYDALDRLTKLATRDNSTTTISEESYVYDNLGNKIRVETVHGTETFMSAYRYNANNQLIEEFYKDSNSIANKADFNYDSIGNRVFYQKNSTANAESYQSDINLLNQLVNIKKNTQTAALGQIDLFGVYEGLSAHTITVGGLPVDYDTDSIFAKYGFAHNNQDISIVSNDGQAVTLSVDSDSDVCYTYDNDGNLVYKSQNGQSTIYLWDALDRLTDVYYQSLTGVNHIQYIYNGDGQRVYEIKDGSLTGYLYDGDCVVAEFDTRGKVRAQYIHGQGLGADVGSLICAQTLGVDGATSERYYSHNWRGDVIGITDESGASLARYRYGAFGELIAGDGAIANNILFSGKRYDSASGLYYFGARYYDASSGRFISRDPMGYIDGPNDYVLAMNNPLLWIDPYGLCGEGRNLNLNINRSLEASNIYIPIGLNQYGDDYLESQSKFQAKYKDSVNKGVMTVNKLTLDIANDIYRNGSSLGIKEVHVPITSLDLSNVSKLPETHLVSFTGKQFASYKDALVYGTVYLEPGTNNTVIGGNDYYDFNVTFDVKSWNSVNKTIRNLETIVGNGVAGPGTKYKIVFTGSTELGVEDRKE